MAKKLQKAQQGKQVPKIQDKGFDKASERIKKLVPKVNDPGFDKATKDIMKRFPTPGVKNIDPGFKMNPAKILKKKSGGTVKKRK